MGEEIRISRRADALRTIKPGTRIEKYSAGKYRWTGAAADYVGQMVPALPGVASVWIERREDRHGPYAQVMCTTRHHQDEGQNPT